MQNRRFLAVLLTGVLLLVVNNGNTQILDVHFDLTPDKLNAIATIPHDEVDMLQVVDFIRLSLGIPICFEDKLSNRKTDSLTNREAAKELEEVLQKRALTRDEATRLQAYRDSLKEGGEVVIGVKRKRFSFEPQTKSLPDLLNSITVASKDYSWESTNGKILIYSKSSPLTWKSTLKIAGRKPLMDVLLALNDLQAKGIGFVDIAGSGVVGMTEMTVGPLMIEDEPIRNILSRITDSIGPETYWVMSGYDDQAFISIRTLSLPSGP